MYIDNMMYHIGYREVNDVSYRIHIQIFYPQINTIFFRTHAIGIIGNKQRWIIALIAIDNVNKESGRETEWGN